MDPHRWGSSPRSRFGLFVREDRLRRTGRLSRPTLIIGAGTVGRLVAQRLLKQPELGLKPIGFLDKEPAQATESSPFSARAGISSV